MIGIGEYEGGGGNRNFTSEGHDMFMILMQSRAYPYYIYLTYALA